jgi:hypothetical protein
MVIFHSYVKLPEGIPLVFAFYFIGLPAGRDQLIESRWIQLPGHLGPLISCPDLSFFIGWVPKNGGEQPPVDGN